MGFSTRAMMAGLLGLGLVAAMPATAEARGDARQTAQPQRASAPAARPASQATRRDAAPARTAAAQPGRPASAQARPAAAGQPRAAAANGRAPAAGARNAAVPYAQGRPAAASPQRMGQNAMANCVVRNGRRVCQAQPRNTAFRWTGGLAPAAMSQTSCPDGTIATTALGHSNVVRCMPL